jgi:Zn ribbon nucleic-acid-binding protein
MKPIENLPSAKRPPEKTVMEKLCRHTRVRVVAREEDVEFVECQECGDVFESSEFKDMAIEENIRPEEA